MDRDEAEQLLEPHFDRLWDCAVAGFNQWRRYPNRPKHLKRTRANVIHDLMMDAVINRFDGVPDARILERRAQTERFLIINEKFALWFKKLDRSLKSKNYPTSQALARRAAQFKLFGSVEILIVGYVLNADETRVSRVSITFPNGQRRPLWFIDLEEPKRGIKAIPAPVVGGDAIQQPRTRVRVRKGEVQAELGL